MGRWDGSAFVYEWNDAFERKTRISQGVRGQSLEQHSGWREGRDGEKERGQKHKRRDLL